MIWKPAKTLGLVAGLIIGLTIGGVCLLLLTTLAKQPLSISLFILIVLFFVSFILFILWIYFYWSFLSLRYDLDRNRLVIRAAGVRHLIPMGAIQRLVRGAELTPTDEFRGLNWPGYSP